MSQVDPRLRRLLAIAVLVAIVALPYHVVVRPIVASHQEYDERIAEMTGMLEAFRSSSADVGALQDTLSELSEQPSRNRSYLSGDSEALVAAQLQNVVKQTVERAGGVLDSTLILPVEQASQFRRVTVRIRMTGTMDSLFLVIYELEGQEPYLFLDTVDISAAPMRRRRATDASAAETRLRASFDVSGYMREI